MERIDLTKGGHPQSLERLCVAALSEGDFEAAFMYADRRCRIQPFAKPHHYTMRAESLVRLGDRDSAMADIATALTLSPEDISANRRMLAWGDTSQQIAAARALVSADDDAATLARALRVLGDSGCDALASARALDDSIVGWAAWNGEEALTLEVKGSVRQQLSALVHDRDHPLAGGAFEHVASFSIPRDKSPTGHRLIVTRGGENVFTLRVSPNCKDTIGSRGVRQPVHSREAGITVIVPIFRDFAATRSCLRSLAPEISGTIDRRAILINDATPEPKLAKYLRSFSSRPGFTLLINEHNLGFVGSVNRALTEALNDDIVLLNADTVVPPGFLDRLSAIGKSDPTIGTITPLSNNGEFTSFPVPFEQNPLPPHIEIKEIDKIAAEVNRGHIIDMPNGIGFCMFISRGCLDAVGPLSKSYQRGYLEDVDFCLRAREQGFRNVCAPSIFVGHHGSRSFGAEKRALVVRNIAIAEAKFPDYRQECALFLASDPLRSAREAIERQRKSTLRYDRVIMSGSGLLMEVAERRAEKLRGDRKKVLLLRVSPSGEEAYVCDSGDASPQSLAFRLGTPAEITELEDHLRRAGVIEVLDPAAMPPVLVDLIKMLDGRVKVVAADAGAICPRGTLRQPDGSVCPVLHGGGVCPSCVDFCRSGVDEWRSTWQALSGGHLEPPCDEAKEFAAGLFSRNSFPDFVRWRIHAAKVSPIGATRIGLMVQGRTVDEFSLIQELLRASVRRCQDQTFIVIGSTLDDLALLRSGNAFVSGEVSPGEHHRMLRHYGIGKLFLPLRRPLFGHPALEAARSSGLPLAYFDWSFGQRRVRRGDLAIDPRCGLPDLVAALGAWGGF